METNIDTLREVSQDQRGLITTAQAAELGISRKRLSEFTADGRIERLRQGLYLVGPAPEDEHRQLRMAWLLLDPTRFAWDRLDEKFPTGVISHRSAARVHRFGDIDADIAELSTVRRIRLRLPHTRLHPTTLTAEDWTVVDGLPVTTATRTIADLAAVGTDSGHLAGVVLDALVTDHTTTEEVSAVLDAPAPAYGYRNGTEFTAALVRSTGVPRNIHALAALDRSPTTDSLERASALLAQALAQHLETTGPPHTRLHKVLPHTESSETPAAKSALHKPDPGRLAEILALVATQLSESPPERESRSGNDHT
ncbi:type IV toxin-antitoxin system AbiEi family antitoxin domain-containing protein [Rhodococcus indonesiensis]